MTVIVVRSGGIAGLRREWRAEPAPDAVEHWIALIDGCPWDEPKSETPGGDRFRWLIRARRDDEPEREAELGDGQIAGPWRNLVDEVRAVSPPVPERAKRDEGRGTPAGP